MTVALPPLTKWVKRLIVLLVVVYAVQILGTVAFGLSASEYSVHVLRRFALYGPGLFGGAVWQPLTYGLLHSTDAFGHILFNCLGLYIFGTRVEESVGEKAFLRLFVGGLLAAAAAVLGAHYLPQLLGRPIAHVPVVGASGAISAVAAVFCWLYWDQWLSFFVVQFKGKHLLLLMVALDVLRATTSQLSLSAHLGGTLFGLLWVSGYWRPDIWTLRFRRWRMKRKLSVVETPPKEWMN